VVEFDGAMRTGSFVASGPSVRQPTTFYVYQLRPGDAVTIPLVIVDACGEWQTFVGSGAAGFSTR
jgi:hypothetical protein